MTPKILGVIAVSLAAAAVAVVLILMRPRPVPPTVSMEAAETTDRMVVDYAYQSMSKLAGTAVTTCGTELVGKELDLTARFRVEKQVLRFVEVKVNKTALTDAQTGCVRKVIEGAQRVPKDDGVKFSFPDDSEYEMDAVLAFAAPTLDYTK